MVVSPLPGFELSEILHSWKSFTSNQINKQAGKTGTFWQKEYFDVIVRNPAHLERVNQYIDQHPASKEAAVEAASSHLDPKKRQDGAFTDAVVEAASSRLDSQKRQDGASTDAAVEAASSRLDSKKRQDGASTGVAPTGSCISGVDASAPRTAQGKAQALISGELKVVSQLGQLRNPDARVALEDASELDLLAKFASSYQGITTGDNPRFICNFWEVLGWGGKWRSLQSTGDSSSYFAGSEQIFLWENGKGVLASSDAARIQGQVVWSTKGIAVRQMRELPITLNQGSPWDMNCATIIPHNPAHLPAIWCFCSSPEYNEAVRRIDQKLNVTNATLVKVPFDLAHWSEVAAERYPNGLPKPYSDDPTQWLFHGHPVPATDPLQVAVARLLGYRWPAELQALGPQDLQAKSASSPCQISARSYKQYSNDAQAIGADVPVMELSEEAHVWIERCKRLEAASTDDDGIVCLPAVRGEQPASERLLALLIDAWETAAPGSWTPSVLDKLLAQADNAGKSLAVWLRDSFFEQHARRFGHCPFIWHIWDGQKDGFAALVNAHKLDAKNLERLIHTYLGDWIRTQELAVEAASSRLDPQKRQDGASTADGAPLRLSAALNLKARLQAILEGEKPYDIFVRWKPLAQQPIGWQPDPNDGIRLNIRPLMTAEVLRVNKKPKLNITWDKDRGKDVVSAPWFGVFGGERINDHHLTLAEKIAAKESK